ncbi:hypothetical protein Vretimale_11096, partial [Volvox reticuliferus]
MEKSRSGGGGELTHALVRPPPQRFASVLAGQHMQASSQDPAAMAAVAQRRDSSGGGAGAPTLDLRPPAPVPTDPRVNPATVGQGRHDGVVFNPHVAVPMVVTGPGPMSTVFATAAAATSSNATVAATTAANPQVVASASQPVLYRPHPPLAPPSQQPSWSSSLGEGPRRSSGGSGAGRRSSAGGGSSSDGSGQERQLHALAPPAPLPAQPPQARPSRPPSPSPPNSCGARDGVCGVGVHPAVGLMPQSPHAQRLPAAPQQPPPLSLQTLPQGGSCTLAPDGRLVAAAAAVMAMPPQPPLPPPKGRTTRVRTFGEASGLQQPQVPAAVAAVVPAPPPRSQAAEELSAILSSLASVAASPTVIPAATRQESPHPNLDRNQPDPSSVVPFELRHGMPPTEGAGTAAGVNGSCSGDATATAKSEAGASDGAQKAHSFLSAPESQTEAAASGDGSTGGAPG